jgi:hypothetical protein
MVPIFSADHPLLYHIRCRPRLCVARAFAVPSTLVRWISWCKFFRHLAWRRQHSTADLKTSDAAHWGKQEGFRQGNSSDRLPQFGGTQTAMCKIGARSQVSPERLRPMALRHYQIHS